MDGGTMDTRVHEERNWDSQSRGPVQMEVLRTERDVLMFQFPSAAQPEVMRAAEKDEHYVAQLCEACYDAFRHTFGTRLAVAYQNEMKLAGRVLYYLLTTGSGLQTLGEEYCDLSQVAGPSGLPATPARRTLLIFYQTVLPYLTERLSARAAARGISLANQTAMESFHNERVGVSESGSATSDTTEAHGSGDGFSTTGGLSTAVRTASQGRNRASSRREPMLSGRLREAGIAVLQRWPVILPSLREAILLIAKAHLMLFYFEGLYYHMGKRAAGIRYMYMGKPTQQRPRYHMLGIFLFIQLSFVVGDWVHRSVIPTLATSMRAIATDRSFHRQGPQGIAVLDEDGERLDDKALIRQPSTAWVEPEVLGSSKCPLCLSHRQHPTATPCGHVFCWTCVAEWCNEKPECPLCRSPVSHPDLVCVYHADF